MNESFPHLRAVLAVLLILQLAGCGGADPGSASPAGDSLAAESTGLEEAPQTSGSDAPALAAASHEAAQTFVPTAADITAYERGLRREVEMLQGAKERLAQAGDDEARLGILDEIQPQRLRQAGAVASSLAEERYEAIANAVNDVLGKLEMGEAARQSMPSEEELAKMPPELRAQVEENLRQVQAAWGDPYEGLDDAAVAALEARVDDLRRLRAEHVGLLLDMGR
ncbi:MAG TPA: hypothetical protein VF339_11280 [Gammaproteobacteria bacterium]